MAVLSHRQLEEWAAYYAVEPFGEDRADLRMARQVWATLQPHSKRQLAESDFVFQFGPTDPPTPEEYKAKAMRAYLGNGGQIVKPHP